ncbi:MAG TPA: type II CAAX endopeptidase family protein [Dehalococcoidia bacterium]|nr:type II CAAX endopeptidase family protein [Dehalococcoidia bacterium]
MATQVPVQVNAPAQPDPRLDSTEYKKQLFLYFGGLIAFYLGAIVVFRPALNDKDALNSGLSIVLMLAPTVGALLAWRLGRGSIQFGKLSWWTLAGLLPVVVPLMTTLIAAAAGIVDFHPEQLPKLMLIAVPISAFSCVVAAGEEIGWRGFLWPLLRGRNTFLVSSAVMFVVWWLYHAPLTLAGWYGFVGGLPAFTIGLIGLVLFVGVLTDRSHSVWPSVLGHGAWNGLVTTYFSSEGNREHGAVFTGSEYVLGEFGLLATVSMFVLGVAAAWWYLRRREMASSQSPTRISRRHGRRATTHSPPIPLHGD